MKEEVILVYVCDSAIYGPVLCPDVSIQPLSLSLSHVYFFRHDGTDSPAEAEDVVVVLNSFHSKIIKVRVSV